MTTASCTNPDLRKQSRTLMSVARALNNSRGALNSTLHTGLMSSSVCQIPPPPSPPCKKGKGEGWGVIWIFQHQPSAKSKKKSLTLINTNCWLDSSRRSTEEKSNPQRFSSSEELAARIKRERDVERIFSHKSAGTTADVCGAILHAQSNSEPT